MAMGTLRFADLQTRPTEVLDLTSLTVDEFQQLVPPFEAAFQAHMADWRLDGKPRTARRYTTYTELSAADARGSAAVYPGLPEDLSPPSGAGAAVRDGPEQSPSVDSCPLGGAAGDAARAGGCSHPVRDGAGAAPRGGRGRGGGHGRADGRSRRPSAVARGGAGPAPASPLLATMGPNGASERPQDPTEQTRYYSGKKRCHTVKNVLLINAVLTILFLSETYAGQYPR